MDKSQYPKYYILKESVCPTCNGEGAVINKLWQQFWADHADAKAVSGQEMMRWFDEHNEGIIPDEEDDCPDCVGARTIECYVDLKEALQAIAA